MKRDKFVVIGCGRFGGQVATERSEEKLDVIVIDEDESSFRKLHDNFGGFKQVGDATQLDILKQGKIEEALNVLIATNRDNVNILIANICDKIFGVPNIYIRLMDTEKEALIESKNIHAIYPYKLSLKSFSEQFNQDDEQDVLS
ncbi:MAG: potassium channel family protein [Acholeplasmataceae bacterium]